MRRSLRGSRRRTSPRCLSPQRGSARPWALVTGASSGIGEALARQLAQQGYDIVLVARDEARLAACARELTEASGAETLIAPTDLGNPDAVVSLADQINAAGISIEVLVNNAGFGLHGAYDHSSVDQATDLLQVQLVALLKLTHRLLPAMKRARHGYILNVASVYSLCPVPYQAVYSATKAFILAFSRALQTELEGSGVVVTVLCPGVTLTRFRSRQGYPESTSVKGMSAAPAGNCRVGSTRSRPRGAKGTAPKVAARQPSSIRYCSLVTVVGYRVTTPLPAGSVRVQAQRTKPSPAISFPQISLPGKRPANLPGLRPRLTPSNERSDREIHPVGSRRSVSAYTETTRAVGAEPW